MDDTPLGLDLTACETGRTCRPAERGARHREHSAAAVRVTRDLNDAESITAHGSQVRVDALFRAATLLKELA